MPIEVIFNFLQNEVQLDGVLKISNKNDATDLLLVSYATAGNFFMFIFLHYF